MKSWARRGMVCENAAPKKQIENWKGGWGFFASSSHIFLISPECCHDDVFSLERRLETRTLDVRNPLANMMKASL